MSRNELLRALELRLTALREELSTAFSRAAGATCSTEKIADLTAFAEHFGAIDLRYAIYQSRFGLGIVS